MSAPLPEVWLRGPLAGFTAQAMPAAHSLLQTAEELERAVRTPRPLTIDELWARPGGVASAGYQLAHLAGSTDRLLSYAADRPLDDGQLAALRAEDALLAPGDAAARPDAEALLAARARHGAPRRRRGRDTPPSAYEAVRHVGRARIPTTVWGCSSTWPSTRNATPASSRPRCAWRARARAAGAPAG
jgi:hypothetical protein